MTTEYGLFNDEGLVEGDFYSEPEARTAAATRYPDDELTVEELCPEHRDHAKDGCEECQEEEEAEERDDSEDEDDE